MSGFWRGRGGFALLVAGALLVGWWLRHDEGAPNDLGANPVLAELTRDVAGAELSRTGGPILVVFTDYRCPNCRADDAALGEVAFGAKVIVRDWPVLGPESLAAARVALAAARQGRYADMHHALMRAPSLDPAGLRAAIAAAGIDAARLDADMRLHGAEIDARLALNARQAAALDLQGTPSYVAGRFLAAGRQGERGLRALVDRAAASPSPSAGVSRTP